MNRNRYSLQGKRAIVTGGAGGIGLAVAREFLAGGAQVELWDHASDGLARARRDLGVVETRTVDITSAQAIEGALRDGGRIDILVNNAGILGEVRPIWKADETVFRRVLEVNLTGTWLVTRAVVRRMREQTPSPHRGHVITVSSVQAKEGTASAGAYAASKAALIALTKTVAKETATEGIHVTCVTPAAADTAMAREITSDRRDHILSRIPMGRFVEVEEIARMIAFLASDDCSFSTGAVFDISGGRATY